MTATQQAALINLCWGNWHGLSRPQCNSVTATNRQSFKLQWHRGVQHSHTEKLLIAPPTWRPQNRPGYLATDSVHRIQLAQDGDEWWAFVKTAMNLQVLHNMENSGTAQQLLALQYGLCSMRLSHIFTFGKKIFERYAIFKKKDIVKFHCLALILGSDVTKTFRKNTLYPTCTTLF